MQRSLRAQCRVPMELAGRRLDQALVELFPDYSRSRLQQWVREGRVQLDARRPKSKDKLRGGELIELDAVMEEQGEWEAEPIALQVVYEDDDLLVIDKPPGLVVHPAAGHAGGTLLNALLHHAPALKHLPRAGIVHRLDKDTSGLLVVAKSLRAHKSLVEQLRVRSMSREYLALVQGVVIAGGTVEGAIGRHPVDRKRMALVSSGKEATTHYRVLARYRGQSLLRVALETGRTHQIRVHMAHIRHPLVGDPVYGGRPRPPAGASEALREALQGFRRQALHAARLALAHPADGRPVVWEAPAPADMQALIAALEADAEAHA
ncbi:23S rRNA pseudouridine(1911/1915/1917) synthase RluD [Ectothiorhodospiraceae bacterium 2226]|nr:23S rRNA pseudouridine(1911/1915/1917) synthase RluD [Ectothiorhodospiraceae bacterium 2226]